MYPCIHASMYPSMHPSIHASHVSIHVSLPPSLTPSPAPSLPYCFGWSAVHSVCSSVRLSAAVHPSISFNSLIYLPVMSVMSLIFSSEHLFRSRDQSVHSGFFPCIQVWRCVSFNPHSVRVPHHPTINCVI